MAKAMTEETKLNHFCIIKQVKIDKKQVKKNWKEH